MTSMMKKFLNRIILVAMVTTGAFGGVPQTLSQSSEPITPPPYTYTTSQIKLERTVSANGYVLEWYRNMAYTCSRRGYYTFVIAYRQGVPPSMPQALWVRLHGGGLGAYGPGGTYLPTAYCAGPGTPCYLDEENLESLASHLQERGLMKNVAAHGGFRFLVPSMCDHDMYMGIGDVEEPYNPNTDANGQRPRADGFLALRSALEYTRQKYATTHIFVHGTSAGSVGALNLASMLAAAEHQAISGVIADSGAVSDLSDLLAQAGCGDKYDPQVLELFRAKMGAVSEAMITPDRVINAGMMRTPIYAFFNTHDQVYDCPPDDQVTITDAQGRTYTGSGAQLTYRRLTDAIKGASTEYKAVARVHEVCAGQDRESSLPCSVHIPTFFASSELGGDRYKNGEDYNAVIMRWVEERLQDPIPASNDRYGVKLGASRDAIVLPRAIQLAGQAGIGWIHFEIHYSHVNPAPGVFRYEESGYDAQVRKVREQGLQILAMLGFSADWNTTAPDNPPPGLDRWDYPPRDYRAFAEYVFQTVSRYKNDIKYWEVWNEPDLPGFWAGTPAQYAELLAVTYDAVKRADPQAKVCLGGLSLGGSRVDPDFLTKILSDPRYPAARYFDVISFHVFGSPDFREEASRRMNYIRNALAQAGAADKPIWITSAGYSSDPSEQKDPNYQGLEGQAQWLRDQIPYLLGLGAEKVLWFNLYDRPDMEGFRYYGLMDNQGNPKPAYFAYKELIQSVSLARPPAVTKQQMSFGNDETVKFTSG